MLACDLRAVRERRKDSFMGRPPAISRVNAAGFNFSVIYGIYPAGFSGLSEDLSAIGLGGQ
jgi:hypothetical protein